MTQIIQSKIKLGYEIDTRNHGATDEEIENLYQHILMEML